MLSSRKMSWFYGEMTVLSGVSSVQNKPYLLQTVTAFTHFSSEVIFFLAAALRICRVFSNFLNVTHCVPLNEQQWR